MVLEGCTSQGGRVGESVGGEGRLLLGGALMHWDLVVLGTWWCHGGVENGQPRCGNDGDDGDDAGSWPAVIDLVSRAGCGKLKPAAEMEGDAGIRAALVVLASALWGLSVGCSRSSVPFRKCGHCCLATETALGRSESHPVATGKG